MVRHPYITTYIFSTLSLSIILLYSRCKILLYRIKYYIVNTQFSLVPARFLQINYLSTVNPLLSPPGGLFFSSTFEGGGGGLIERGVLKREGGGLFNLAKRITCSKNTVV